MEKKKWIAVLFLLTTIIMWGVSFVSIKITMRVLPPLNLAFFRLFIAIFILFAMMKIFTPAKKLHKEDIPRFILSGVLGISLYFFLENTALMLISANAASIIVAFLPVASMVGEVLFLKKKIRRVEVISVLFSIVGVYMVIGGNLGEGSSLKGILYMLGGVLCFSVFQLISKPLFDRYSDLEVGFYQTFFALISFIPFLWTEKINWQLLDVPVAFNFIFLAVFCSGLATYFYMYSLNNLGVTVSSVFLNLMPVVTFLTSFLIFGEKLTLLQSIGSVVVILSVTVVTLKHQEEHYVPEI